MYTLQYFYNSLVSASDVMPTDLWLTSDAYGTQKWKHFRGSEVIVRLVELYRISGRRVSRPLTFRLETKML